PGASAATPSGVELPTPKCPGRVAGVGPRRRDEDRRTVRYRVREGNEAGRDGRSGVGAFRSTDEAGELASRGPGGGKGRPSHRTVGGKHDRGIGTGDRVNATSTDRGIGEASAGDELHLAGPPHRRWLVARSLPANAARRGHGRGRTDGRRLCSEPAGEPGGVAGAGQVRAV